MYIIAKHDFVTGNCPAREWSHQHWLERSAIVHVQSAYATMAAVLPATSDTHRKRRYSDTLSRHRATES